jgi:hypothetical protein
MSAPGAAPFLVLLVAATTSSLLIAVLYQHFLAERASGSQLYRSFGLVGLSITAIFVTVQFSLPLSIGLLAALSIVRFRTPIKEPEEIGILMVVVAASVASATFKLQFLGILLAAVFAALAAQRVFLHHVPSIAPRHLVTVVLPVGADAGDRSGVQAAIAQHLGRGRLEQVTTRAGELRLAYSIPSSDTAGLEAFGAAVGTASLQSRVEIHPSRTRS